MDLPIARIGELAGDDVFVGAVEEVYVALDRRIAARVPRCINRGQCCKFDSFGHNLFVTSVELAYFMGRREGPLLAGAGSCPYHQRGRCTARRARPVGCRIFFCEPASQGWQSDETETTLREIKRLHTQFCVRYAYVEWLSALNQLNAHRSPQNMGAL